MQAPRNWRMKVERYRLLGAGNSNGDASIVNRPESLAKRAEKVENNQPELKKVTAA